MHKLIQKLAGWIRNILILAVLGALLTFISLWNEKNYQENCRNLQLQCEPGRIQRWANQTTTWIDARWSTLQKKIQGEEANEASSAPQKAQDEDAL